ncbi:Spc7 kinetochore protein-domain-containing protein [Phlebopus sp. FC_14]|nr:Spc7 kinetochore protein-domain-containing protein [Phlebopus sp. FC_14]
MPSKRGSPSRRNSIAVANYTHSHPGHKRRAHSIAPGDRLSPASKARRSLAPRKSILKAAISIADDDATQSMDITHDIRGVINDNTARKSLGRRVSFANHAHVRLFEVPDHNTNSTASPQSSPAADRDNEDQRTPNDENAYPGAEGPRRRSSVRRSIAFSEGGGEESMEMDSDDAGFSPAAFFREGNGLQVDDGFEAENGFSDGDDMDVTEAIPRNIIRKRSLSLGVARPPLANFAIPQTSSDVHSTEQQEPPAEHSFIEQDPAQSQSFASEGDISQPMEFTVPLIRPPEPPSEAWLALRSVTHSGNTPYIPSSDDDEDDGVQEMELTDAVSRLQAARASLGLEGAQPENEGQHDSFTSTEDSFVDENSRNDNEGNQTVNVTQLMRRVSLGASTGDSSMDVTSVYSSQQQSREEVIDLGVPELPSAPSAHSEELARKIPVVEHSIPTSTTLADSLAEQVPVRPTIFRAPEASQLPAGPSTPEQASQPATISRPLHFSFTPQGHPPSSPSCLRPPIPSKTKEVPTSPRKFTAAFAPPVARPSPKKRRNNSFDPSDRQTAAKKHAGSEIIPPGSFANSRALVSPAGARAKLSPNKKGPSLVQPESHLVSGPSKLASVSFRRPSGYFAQRKSLGGAVLNGTDDQLDRSFRERKVAGVERKSIAFIGDSDGEAWRRFDADAERERVTREAAIGELASPESSVPSSNAHLQSTPIQIAGDSPEGALAATGLSVQHPSLRALPTRPSLLPQSPVPAHHGLGSDDEQDQDDAMPVSENDALASSTEQWKGKVEEGDINADEGPKISIERFFEMTGIRFMDEIGAPRRSTFHPSALRPSRRASTEAQIPLADYVVAMAVEVPQLELYAHVSKDLQAWIERIKGNYKEADEEALNMTPPLFQEFVNTDESGQAELLHQLKLIKVHNHGQAKSEWYDCKMRWVEQLYQKADQGFKDLEADAKFLEAVIRQAQDMVPALQLEYDNLMQELEQEKADVAELEACDQDYLNELKATIAEQSVELETFRADVAEASSKLVRLEEKLQDIESQKKEATTAIQEAERLIHVQKNSTRAEVFQLKDELEALQNLHVWKATKILPDLFEYIYASCYCVTIPCINFRPVAADIQIKRTDLAKSKYKDPFPVMSDLMLRTAKQLVAQAENLSIRQVVEHLGDFWSSCSQLQAQMKLMAIKYPVLMEENPSGFSATATLLFPSVKSKALISFIFDTPNFSTWPMLVHSTRCNVEVVYGPIQRDIIQNAIIARLQQASPTNNHACLLDACMEASDCFA